MIDKCSFHLAVQAWQSLLGEGRVITTPKELKRYASSTLSSAKSIASILKIRSIDELKKVVDTAYQYEVPVYPFSCGKNWGYGDMCPPTDHQTLLDLSGMNKIIEVNEELAYAAIEPGVTQQQLYQYLYHHNLPFMIDCTGSSPDSSIVGNIVDGGFGHSSYGHREKYVLGLEAILGTGKIFRTGFGHDTSLKTPYIFPQAIGPRLQGVFIQSNFGIITKLIIELQPKPKTMALMLFHVGGRSNKSLHNAVNVIKELKHRKLITSIMRLSNNPYVKLQKYSQWIIIGGIYSQFNSIEPYKSEILTILKKYGLKAKFISPFQLGVIKKLHIFTKILRFNTISDKFSHLLALYALLQGKPTAYYLSKMASILNQKDDVEGGDFKTLKTGFMWVNTVLPCSGFDILCVDDICKSVFQKYGLKSYINFSFISERAVIAIMCIIFQKDSQSSCENAESCYIEIRKQLNASGYKSYRENSQSMGMLIDEKSVDWEMIATLKKDFDPKNIISPGRYAPIK